MSWLVAWPEYKAVEYTASSVLAQLMWADALVGERNFSSLTKRMDVLRKGARMICRRLKMVDLEILQVGQSWLAEGFGGIGVPIMLQISS